jgi:hypothetical protein
MPHITTHYRVIVTAGHHRQPRNPGPRWIEPYAPSTHDAQPNTSDTPLPLAQLGYVDGGEMHTADFLFWSASDGTDGQTSTDLNTSFPVANSSLEIVAWFVPRGGGPGEGTGYIIDAFSDSLNDFVNDDFVSVGPDAGLTHDANVVGWVPTTNAETLTETPGTIHTGEVFERWIGGHPNNTTEVTDREGGIIILFGVTNDAPGLGYIPGVGPVPIDPGWGSLLASVQKAAGLAALSRTPSADPLWHTTRGGPSGEPPPRVDQLVGRVTAATSTRPSSPTKSAGLVVYSGRPLAAAVAAIIRSATRRRLVRPARWTAELSLPNRRAASASNGIGSNSLSVRCSTSSRAARSERAPLSLPRTR